jgi:chitinase
MVAESFTRGARFRVLMKWFYLVLAASCALAQAGPKVVAYVPNWIDLAKFSETIAYPKLTHINIAFENPVDDEGNLSYQEADATVLKKAQAAGVKVLVSIGGGGASGDMVMKARYAHLLAAENRAAFVGKLADYVSKHGFDGVDVDIEGPSITADYGDFIMDLGAALKPKGKLLTAALSQGYGGSNVPDAALGHLDFLNIMAYDATGTWNPNRPGQHSSMEFAKNQVTYWIGRGVPAGKAVLGVPFYGYGFGDSGRNYGYPYVEIVTIDAAAAQSDETGKTIFYNGIPTIQAKAKYVMDEKLGGIMIWSLNQDAPGEPSLLNALDAILQPKAAK